MTDCLLQILLVLFLGVIATYDTLQSKRKQVKENSDKTREMIDLPG
jgi:hypothetical protein